MHRTAPFALLVVVATLGCNATSTNDRAARSVTPPPAPITTASPPPASVPSLPAPEPTEASRLTIDGMAHDGRWTVELDPVALAPGVASDRRLALVNRSSEPVTLQEIRTSCKCLVATLDPTVVAPGASATLTVRLEPHRTGASNQIAWMTFADGSVLRLRVDLEVR